MPSITTFAPEHIPHAVELWESTEHMCLSDSDEPEALESYLLRNPGLSFVAIRSGRVVGTILCGHDGRRGCIYHLAVADFYRRNRLGSELLRKSLESLERAGISDCHAFVFDDNPFANLFWQKQGWEYRDDLLVFTMDSMRRD